MIKKFFGQGDVFIYALSPTHIRGVDYNTGDLISYFSSVNLALNYNLEHKEGSDTVRQVSHIKREPYSLNIGNIDNTFELDKLFFKGGEAEETTYSVTKKYENVRDLIYLQEIKSPLEIKMFSNGRELNKEDYEYDQEEKSVSIPGFFKELEVLMTFKEEGEVRTFDKPDIGYVKIEATIRGEMGNQKGTFVLRIPTADLISEPAMDLTEMSNYALGLSFAIVNSRAKPPTTVFING